MIKPQFDVLLQIQFYNIIKILNEIPKYCQTLVLAIIMYQANSMS